MIKQLVEAGVHFGHLVSRWCPKMKPYIWGHRNKVHLIDVSMTARHLEKAAKFLESVAAEGKQILWVGTKKAAQDVIRSAASRTHMPYVDHRWIGGTLTNKEQVNKSIARLQHHEDIIEKSVEFPHYTKKEYNVFQKVAQRLEKNVGGIRTLRWPIGALIVVDVLKEAAAIREANQMGVPVIALVDTNGDPSLVDFVIPGNDDAPKAISFVLAYLADAVERGQAAFVEKKKQGKAADADDMQVSVKAHAAYISELDEDIDEDEGGKKVEKGGEAAIRRKRVAPSKPVLRGNKKGSAPRREDEE